ncbi:MAG: glycine oxidase ThiO [Gemmataceae bacterium]
MSPQADVLIVGGGVVGLTCACFRAREGLRVEVVERGEPGQESSWAGAGILPPASLAHARRPYDRLRALSADLYPSLSCELRERTGVDNGYLRCGGLEFVPASAPGYEEEWCSEGVACEKLDEQAARELEPALATGLGAVHYLPELAQLRNPRHVKALAALCHLSGVRLHAGCSVSGFEQRQGKVAALSTSSGSLRAGQYLVAAGAWTGQLLAALGLQVPVRPVRGQIALLNTGVPLFRRVLMLGARYLVPRPDGRVLIGSTEEEAGFDKRNTAAAIRDLIELGTSLVPDLAQANLERSWAGLRPGSPDGMPFLGPAPGFDNLFLAAGHFRAGIQLAPATAQVMTELMAGKPPSVPLEGFGLER